MGGTYNAYLSNSTMNHISIHNDGSVMNAIVYNGIGCDYNAPDGNQSASGKIKWVQETGNIIND